MNFKGTTITKAFCQFSENLTTNISFQLMNSRVFVSWQLISLPFVSFQLTPVRDSLSARLRNLEFAGI